MASADQPDERVASRADGLNPEEVEAGSDDPEAQAEAILDESDTRTDDRPGTAREHRSSDDITDDVDH